MKVFSYFSVWWVARHISHIWWDAGSFCLDDEVRCEQFSSLCRSL